MNTRNLQHVDGLNKRIETLIYSTDKSLRQLSKEMGLSSNVMCTWFNQGANPRAYTIIQLCKYFDVSADWLLGLKEGETV